MKIKLRNTEIIVTQGIAKTTSITPVIANRKAKFNEGLIRSLMRRSLKSAERSKLKTLAFSVLVSEDSKFPYLATAKIMAQEFYRRFRLGKSNIKRIIVCCNNKETLKIFDKGIIAYLLHAIEVLQYGPFVTVDAIIKFNGKIVVIERSNPPFGYALPGGFVDYGESLEEAVTREAKEETGLSLLNLRQFHTYSNPNRDPRFHTIGTVFTAQGKGRPKAGDDARGLRLVSPNEIGKLTFAFDHKKIIQDCLKIKKIF